MDIANTSTNRISFYRGAVISLVTLAVGFELFFVIGWLARRGYFTMSREEKLFRSAEWRVIGVKKSAPSSLMGEEFIVNESLWSVPPFEDSNKMQAGLKKPSGLYSDPRRKRPFEIKYGTLKLDSMEFRIIQIDYSEMLLEVVKEGDASGEQVRFHRLTAAEDAGIAWNEADLRWQFCFLQTLAHCVWFPQFVTAISGFWLGSRISGTKKKLWRTILIATLAGAVMGSVIGELAVILNNRNTGGWKPELCSPPLLFVLFAVVNFPIAIVAGLIGWRRQHRSPSS
jgi:hypothetical protein